MKSFRDTTLGSSASSEGFTLFFHLSSLSRRGLRTNPYGNCLGHRRDDGAYTWESYTDVEARIGNVASALIANGAKKTSIVAIYSTNCPEWVITARACNAQSLILCPLYDTLGKDACQFILNQTETTIVVVGARQFESFTAFAAQCPLIKTVIKIGNVSPEEAGKSISAKLISFESLENEGANQPVDANPPNPEDIATICYTSGTTGDPKGALLSHRALTADVAGVKERMEHIVLGPSDCYLSYLPLAHMFERLIEEMIFSSGAGVGFYRGNVSKIFEDINALKPTLFVSVPRIYTRLSDRIRETMEKSGFVTRSLFNLAMWTKKQNLRYNIHQHWLWDRLVFSRIKALVGGRVRLMVSGAAPLSPDVMSFLRASFCCNVMEGYGQTECAAAATASLPEDCSLGNVGPPLSCVEIKLVDVPEMMYFSSDMPCPRGEVCFRGPNVFSGYFKGSAKSPIDADGWLHSGDVGQWNSNGTLSIIDRRKNIFKLAQGEYVAPEHIEAVYSASEFVSQIFVTGSSFEASLVAIVVPSETHSLDYALRKGIRAKNLEELCHDDSFKEKVMFDMRLLASRAGLKGFETCADIYLTTTEFTPENGLMTPTFKLKRPVASKVFQREVTQLYESLKKRR